MRPTMPVKKTRSIQRMALSMPRAFASRATQTRIATLRATMARKKKIKNDPQMPQPAALAAADPSFWARAVAAKKTTPEQSTARAGFLIGNSFR